MDMRLGIVPLPTYVLLVALIAGFVATGKVPNDICISIAILTVGGFSCAELGKRLPFFRNIGAAAIFATFIPSYLAFSHLIPAPVLKNVVDFTKSTNFLYLFISSIIVGSILSMDRSVLIKGFIKIFVPLAIGSVVAGVVGTAVGVALGQDASHTFFYLVAPIMAGGVGEGAIPLSIGYAGILPVVMLFVAVIFKLSRAVSPQLQQSSYVAYKFFSTAVTYPLLFAIGASMTPWDKLVSAFNVVNLAIIVSTVVSLMATGFLVGRKMNMYPIEAAIINACHSGQGGTGDVAILTAANRMQLMPFAQIATRIGGAITVTLTLIAMARLH